MLEIVFLIATVAGVVWLRRRWPSVSAWRPLPLAYPLGLMAWTLLAIVVLSYTVPRLSEIPFHWGSIGKVLTLGVLLVWPVVAVPSRAARWLAGALTFAFTVLSLFDLAYSRHFGSLFPVTAFLGVGQGWDIRESIATLLRARDLWLLPSAVAAVVVAVGVPSAPIACRRDRRITLLVTVLLVAVGAGVLHHNLTGWRGEKVLSHARWARHVGVFGVHVLDTARMVREAVSRGDISPEQLEALRGYVTTDRYERPVPESDPLFGVARGANVLVVQLESVQQFVVGARVRGAPVTPFLNSLTVAAAYYPLITDQSGESNTADTEYLVNTGLHPMRQGAVVFRRPENHFVAWPSLLANAGYTTMSAHPWDRGFWNRAIVHPKYGFARSLFRRELGGIVDQVGWGTSDRAFYEAMVPLLRDLEQPYAAYLITLMSHHPYTFYPQTRRRLDLGDLEHTMLGAYLHLMHEVDASLRNFLGALEAGGALDNTLLVLFGDHDARLQASSADVAAGARELGMTEDEVVQLVHRDARADFVPLFIRLPGGELTGTIPVAGGQIDIGATILFLLGIEQPASFLGRPLLPNSDGFAARIDGAAISNDRWFVSQGVDVPAQGLCLSLPERASLPISECHELSARAEAQVKASWQITEQDLAAMIGR